MTTALYCSFGDLFDILRFSSFQKVVVVTVEMSEPTNISPSKLSSEPNEKFRAEYQKVEELIIRGLCSLNLS
jgi:hypothetical protein